MESASRFAVEHRPPGALRPYERNARSHSKRQIRQIADSIKRFGFTNPVLISDDDEIIAGHGRVEAAKLLGLESVPTLRLSHLSEAERRTYVLTDNKLALNAAWDQDILAIKLQALVDLDFDVTLIGFSLAEVDLTIDAARDRSPSGRDAADRVPLNPGPPVSRPGDLWLLGRHRLLCGDARNGADYDRLMDGAKANLVFTDPPYNVEIDGYVAGKVRAEAIALHPTAKPVAMVADAIRDCSRRGDIVLDAFGGSGTTLIAAELCGRVCHMMEFDPAYADTIVRRYQAVTGKTATLADTGASFDATASERGQEVA